MLKYTTIKPRVYVEATVVSYLVARPSNNPISASRQRATQRLWQNYADRFEFVISELVRTEIQRGDATAAQQRIKAISSLTVLKSRPETNVLVQKLLDAGAVPRNSVPMQNILLLQQYTVLITWYRGTINIL